MIVLECVSFSFLPENWVSKSSATCMSFPPYQRLIDIVDLLIEKLRYERLVLFVGKSF
jgi:hypothetical protein